MKKGKLIVSALALFIAIGAAYAFKASNTLPGDLYYYNDHSDCVKAPCEINNNTGMACLNAPLYTDDACTSQYGNTAWVTEGGK
jgi:hypothetical protein